MTDAKLVNRLLDQWDELREQGRDITPETLCGDHPELLPQIKQKIKAIKAVEDKFHGSVPAVDKAPAAHAPDEQLSDIPTEAGGYRLEEEIARGGMGMVVRAVDPEIERTLAVKLMLPEARNDAQAHARFLEEAKITGQLQHPGIPPVHKLGQLDNGLPFFAMKLIKGETFSSLLKQRYSPTQDQTRYIGIFGQICQTIGYAHSRGVIHRDLKPHNIMVGAFGEVQVMDWGLAKFIAKLGDESELPNSGTVRSLKAHGDQALSHTGDIMGTPAYIAPEQARGEIRTLDTRADVFGLGAILCEILTGKPAYQGGSTYGLLLQAADNDVTDAYQRLDGCGADPELVQLCKRCLAADRRDRPRNGAEVANAVERYETQVQERLRQAELTKTRTRVLLMMAAVVLVVLVAGIAGTVWGLVEMTAARHTAEVARHDEQQRANGEMRAKIKAQKAEAAEREAKQKAVAAVNLTKKQLTQIKKGADILAGIFHDLDTRKIEKQGQKLQLVLGERLKKAAEQLKGEAIADPLVTAKLQNTLGISLLHLGHIQEALPLLDEALQTRQDLLGVDHRDTLTSMGNLACGYQEGGQLDKALPLFEQTLKLTKAKLGDGHPSTLASMGNLATCYLDAGQPNKALSLFEQTLKLTKAKLGDNHPDTLTSMNNLAKGYRAAGQLDKALSLYEQTLKLMKTKLGDNHPDTLTSMNNLAKGYRAAGQLDKALPLFEQTLKLTKAKLGDGHPSTLTSMNNLAACYLDAEQPKKALPLFEQTLKLRQAKLGAEHPDTLTSMNNLAEAYRAAGQLDKALPLYEQTLKLMKTKLGDNHPDTLSSMNNLAGAYRAAGQLDKALPLFEQTLKLRQAKLGDNHPDTLGSMNNLALGYQAAGRVDKALPLFEQTLKLRQTKLGADHPHTLTSMNNLAALYWRQRRLDQSIPLFERTLRARRDCNGTEHPETIRTMANLGVNYLDSGRLREAVSLLEQAWVKGRHHASLRWVGRAYQLSKQLLAQEKRLQEIIQGAQADTAEQLQMAELCRRYLKRYRDAVQFYANAFGQAPKLAREVQDFYRYKAARAAVLAAAGKGRHAAQLNAKEQSKLRRLGHDWLRADLTAWKDLLSTQPFTAIKAQEVWQHCQKVTDLSSVRNKNAQARLPEDERAQWQKLWADVKDFQKQAKDSYKEQVVKGMLTAANKEHAHKVKLTGGKVYVITMQSKQFDTFLRLHDANGNKLAENDDIVNGKNLNSRIEYTPKLSGTYRLIATSYQQKGRGAYEIVVREFKALRKPTTPVPSR